MIRNYVCPTCESEYELTSAHVPVRDKDSISCRTCGNRDRSWNGSRTWDAKLKLLKRGTRPSP
jgi:hypothetical protein